MSKASDIGVLIKKLRTQASLTQQQLGDKVSVTKASISAYEKGKAQPSDQVLTLLAKEFDLSIDEFKIRLTDVTSQPNHIRNADFSPNMVAVELPFAASHLRASLLEHETSLAHIGDLDSVQLYVNTKEEVANYIDAIVIEAGEDNMEPLLHAGDKVIAWPVPESEWEQVYNQVCVVAYKDTVTIKAVRENELPTRGLLTLYAQNTTAGFLSVQRQQIKAIWRVEEFFERPKIRL
ncbi:helix-turn-helix domain-containing protein [Hymenobacter crusticola]|uniref:HTH cro/C1-type domain-containing protein n=1 Tax=Hymenobacter crusticola TaxID=1770526 RepID=A0A243W5N9_9BACT|nr:helix-turn-helix transcriptional regulator [Hymenobacter crusticola]OUJ68975.1 hypothetical protein BXP70_27100 [Hymenobacter crusticola]